MQSIKSGLTIVKQNFNRDTIYRYHFVEEFGKTLIPFCGTKSKIVDTDEVGHWIKDIRNGKEIKLSDDSDRVCKKCVMSVLAPGSDQEKSKKRIDRHRKRKERENQKKLDRERKSKLQAQIIERFLSKCVDCSEPLNSDASGFLTHHDCEKCDVKWQYLISCKLDGLFEVSIGKNKGYRSYKKAIGNILWDKPFIKFSDDLS